METPELGSEKNSQIIVRAWLKPLPNIFNYSLTSKINDKLDHVSLQIICHAKQESSDCYVSIFPDGSSNGQQRFKSNTLMKDEILYQGFSIVYPTTSKEFELKLNEFKGIKHQKCPLFIYDPSEASWKAFLLKPDSSSNTNKYKEEEIILDNIFKAELIKITDPASLLTHDATNIQKLLKQKKSIFYGEVNKKKLNNIITRYALHSLDAKTAHDKYQGLVNKGFDFSIFASAFFGSGENHNCTSLVLYLLKEAGVKIPTYDRADYYSDFSILIHVFANIMPFKHNKHRFHIKNIVENFNHGFRYSASHRALGHLSAMLIDNSNFSDDAKFILNLLTYTSWLILTHKGSSFFQAGIGITASLLSVLFLFRTAYSGTATPRYIASIADYTYQVEQQQYSGFLSRQRISLSKYRHIHRSYINYGLALLYGLSHFYLPFAREYDEENKKKLLDNNSSNSLLGYALDVGITHGITAALTCFDPRLLVASYLSGLAIWMNGIYKNGLKYKYKGGYGFMGLPTTVVNRIFNTLTFAYGSLCIFYCSEKLIAYSRKRNSCKKRGPSTTSNHRYSLWSIMQNNLTVENGLQLASVIGVVSLGYIVADNQKNDQELTVTYKLDFNTGILADKKPSL